MCNRKHNLMWVFFFCKTMEEKRTGEGTREYVWRLFGTGMFPNGKTVMRKKERVFFFLFFYTGGGGVL